MWGSLKSYLYETNVPKTQAPDIQNTNNSDEDWVFVDMSGEEIKKNKVKENLIDKNKEPIFESKFNFLPLLDISNANSPQSSPPLSPTKIEEDWLIAPPPCFVLNCPSMIEISPLEDLLIEHPSMSVYNRIPGFCGRINKKVDSEFVKDDCTATEVVAKSRTNSLNQDKVPILEGKDSSKKTAIIPSKSQLDLKAFLDQTENMKPVQHAKWESDQFKLCPSYMNRQNRVHQYQSRKHHNQKKKSLARPYAEKCKHSF